MKLFDFGLQAALLLAYVVLSPLVFGLIYPATGDVSLIWTWVVMVAGVTSLTSIVLNILINLIIAPEKTYKFKVAIPLLLSSTLCFFIGETSSQVMTGAFLSGNSMLLLTLHLVYVFIFMNKIES